MSLTRVAMTLEQAANALTILRKPAPTCPQCGPIRWAKCEACGTQNAVYHESDPTNRANPDHFNFCKQCAQKRDEQAKTSQTG